MSDINGIVVRLFVSSEPRPSACNSRRWGNRRHFQASKEEGISPGTAGRQRDSRSNGSRIFQTAPAGTMPIQGSGWPFARDRAVGVGPGGSPAASAARSTVSRPPNSQPPFVPYQSQPSRHRQSHKPTGHLSRRLALLCCSDFPVDFSVGNSFPTLIQADFSFCHRCPLAFSSAYQLRRSRWLVWSLSVD